MAKKLSLTKVQGKTMRNAMTIDVEDYFQVSAFAKQIKPSTWESFASRVERNTHRLLDLFDEHEVRVTFFVLGWIAERFPRLVRSLAARGHEVACHGYSHQLIYNQPPKTFWQETLRSKALLEDQVQKPVNGYRAASYSITKRSLWALDILAELEFSYDSSIFPVHHDFYGIPKSPRWPYRLITPSGGSIIEFPLSTISISGYRLPVAGGGYFRLYPYALSRFALRHINSSDRRPFIFYMHPWEIDAEQPRISAGRLSTFRHYLNLSRCETRLKQLLADFRFEPVSEVIKTLPALGTQNISAVCNVATTHNFGKNVSESFSDER
jgi:polysaccharide deacetylase family protein (PEP-CTERM system associated)